MSYQDLANTWTKPQVFAGGHRLRSLTTAQRDALTGSEAPASGDAIFNTTTGGPQVYGGSSFGWLDAGPQTGTVGTVTTAATTAAAEYGNGIQHFTKLTMTAFAVGTS